MGGFTGDELREKLQGLRDVLDEHDEALEILGVVPSLEEQVHTWIDLMDREIEVRKGEAQLRAGRAS